VSNLLLVERSVQVLLSLDLVSEMIFFAKVVESHGVIATLILLLSSL
jgi:hypothetical protein